MLRRNHKMCYAVSLEILSRSGVYGVTEVLLRRNGHLGFSSAVIFKWLRRRDNIGSELSFRSLCYAVFPKWGYAVYEIQNRTTLVQLVTPYSITVVTA